MLKGTFEHEGNLWGVPYGEYNLYDDDKYITTLFNWEVALGDLFIKDLYLNDVISGDQALIMADGLTQIVERHKSGEINDG